MRVFVSPSAVLGRQPMGTFDGAVAAAPKRLTSGNADGLLLPLLLLLVLR